jgi:hypothetical protein
MTSWLWGGFGQIFQMADNRILLGFGNVRRFFQIIDSKQPLGFGI